MPPLGILEYAGVGIHNQSDEAMRRTHEVVTLIYSQCPVEILFADPAGLVAAFLEPVSEQQAWEFEDLIYSVADESWCGLPNAYQDLVDEGIPQIPSIADYILDEQRFRLWWD